MLRNKEQEVRGRERWYDWSVAPRLRWHFEPPVGKIGKIYWQKRSTKYNRATRSAAPFLIYPGTPLCLPNKCAAKHRFTVHISCAACAYFLQSFSQISIVLPIQDQIFLRNFSSFFRLSKSLIQPREFFFKWSKIDSSPRIILETSPRRHGVSSKHSIANDCEEVDMIIRLDKVRTIHEIRALWRCICTILCRQFPGNRLGSCSQRLRGAGAGAVAVAVDSK